MLKTNVPQRGDFQWHGVSGSFEPTLNGAADPHGYFGLVPELPVALASSAAETLLEHLP